MDPAAPKASRILGGSSAELSAADAARWFVLWPSYIDKAVSPAQGRKIGAEYGGQNASARGNGRWR